MKKIRRTFFAVVLLGMIASCASGDKRLEEALAFAGENRQELEKVLAHYNQDPEKQEAARFLIRNMPHWYAYVGWQLDSVRQILVEGKFPKEAVNKWKKFSFYSLPKVYDAHVITAGYLIENIDLAFEVWKKYPWNASLGFDDFCELILPYRIDNEPLSAWRKLYYQHYGTRLDSLYQGKDVVEACRVVCKELRRQPFCYSTDFTIPHLDGEFLFHHPVGYCRESCDLTLYAMRACGVPVVTDFFRYSPDYQHYHSWNMLRDTTGRFLIFDFDGLQATREVLRTDSRKKGKVYRYCFGEQESPTRVVDASTRGVPSFFKNLCIKDVTADYFGESEVTVPVEAKDKYIYLGIFTPKSWLPVDVARREGDVVTFRNLEPGIIYQPLRFDGKQHAAGYPFIYRDGKAEILKPDTGNPEAAVLKRKMSFKPTIAIWLRRAITGARIEGSGDASFRQADLLYEFKDSLDTNYCELDPLETRKKYNYVRYLPPVNTRAELAELTLYKDTLCREKIPLHLLTRLEPVGSVDNVTDDNILTFFQAREVSSPLVYRLAEKTSIGKIVFSPRNDDNYVWPGDCYELFYQDGINEWQSLGMQVADGRELRYSIPQNALLWLRNRTKGREEQVFVYRDGKQVFTIDL